MMAKIIITSNIDTQHTRNNTQKKYTPSSDIYDINDQNEKYGMLDSGTADNFFAITANITNVRSTQNSIIVVIPSLPPASVMPKDATSSYIIPKLVQ